MIAHLSLLCALLLGPDQQAVTPPNPVQALPYVELNTDIAGAEAEAPDPETETLQSDEPADPPKFWIGVHVVAIPEPLAAHLGKDGLMVMNIVKDSPADKAGLERYDIVRSFNGKPIHEMSDLVNAIQELKQQTGKLEIVRNGKPSTLKLAAVARAESGPPEYKYEDPEAAQVSPQGRGMIFRRDPSGAFRMDPIGPLSPLPPSAPFMQNDDWHKMLEPLLNGIDNWNETDDDANADDNHAQVEVRVQTNNNGEKLSIHRSADGKLEVERTDADGKTETKTYDNMKALRDGDKEAFDTFNRSAGHGHMSFRFSPGSMGDSKQWQADIQAEIQRQLDAAPRINSVQPAAPAQPAQPRSAPKANKPNQPRRMQALSSSVSVEDSGRVLVTITENGKTRQYEFANVDELKDKEPQLYEKVKPLLEQKGALERRLIAAA